jgi:hypothetical protein
MTDKLAILGGPAASTLEQASFTQWPIYGEEEVAAVARDPAMAVLP